MADSWLTADGIAGGFGSTVYTWSAEKAVPDRKFGRLWRIQASEIDECERRGGVYCSSRDEDAE
ncbi:hypothetical protein KACC15558_34510 [Brevibacterium ammoniilyticum]|uniref:Uncharacterized protein n=1 Tax=Brevibacterium ammoniilyticum TaxID=1046555 RepID=A0ABP9UAM0_9MICO